MTIRQTNRAIRQALTDNVVTTAEMTGAILPATKATVERPSTLSNGEAKALMGLHDTLNRVWALGGVDLVQRPSADAGAHAALNNFIARFQIPAGDMAVSMADAIKNMMMAIRFAGPPATTLPNKAASMIALPLDNTLTATGKPAVEALIDLPKRRFYHVTNDDVGGVAVHGPLGLPQVAVPAASQV